MSETKHTYIALIRAINVGGRWFTDMAALKQLFEACGFSDVRTYLITGNVVFKATATDAAQLARQIEHKLTPALGFEVTVFVLTPERARTAFEANPFTPEKLDKQQHCHLMFLSAQPKPESVDRLMQMAAPEYRFKVGDQVLYYAYDRAYEGRNRRAINFEKVLGVTGTSRTWKVVRKLLEMADGGQIT